MLNADRAPYFSTCPRCSEGGLEHLSTHSYCHNCNYSSEYSEQANYSDDDLPIPKWALDALKTAEKTVIRKLKDKSAFDEEVSLELTGS